MTAVERELDRAKKADTQAIRRAKLKVKALAATKSMSPEELERELQKAEEKVKRQRSAGCRATCRAKC